MSGTVEFDVIVKRVSNELVRVTAAKETRFFWVFGSPYVVTSPIGKSPLDLATLGEAAEAGLVTLTEVS
jgi:hypothetical protein